MAENTERENGVVCMGEISKGKRAQLPMKIETITRKEKEITRGNNYNLKGEEDAKQQRAQIISAKRRRTISECCESHSFLDSSSRYHNKQRSVFVLLLTLSAPFEYM
ncbi:hypothetical protein L1887_38903 [Cichorium endivia]|nr:hypothetical protein L1887_38903 [Cichorium endivia]